ncbi:hypothetical protein GL263_06025 [Streptomyces durbertensis]|uniref:Uncharacterized protein n=1 Tax=Streptomyces durbertensis TaxID=2448886 RepID=A0ABR6ECS2_9ACTN|nr:hypothetical protein [Streptomyces durbertensis]MBB1243126.1 hypothetical protein [Streptomyces durbertensis]
MPTTSPLYTLKQQFEPKRWEKTAMSKRGNKRRARKKKAANHGKRPNA